MRLPPISFCWPVTRQPQRLEIAWGPPGRSAAVSQPNQEAWLPGLHGPHGPGLPVLATGRRRLWDVPPDCNAGEGSAAGQARPDWIGSFCCRFWLLQILKPSQRHSIHLSNSCAIPRRESRAELQLVFKMPPVVLWGTPCRSSEKMTVRLVPSLCCRRRQELLRHNRSNTLPHRPHARSAESQLEREACGSFFMFKTRL